MVSDLRFGNTSVYAVHTDTYSNNRNSSANNTIRSRKKMVMAHRRMGIIRKIQKAPTTNGCNSLHMDNPPSSHLHLFQIY